MSQARGVGNRPFPRHGTTGDPRGGTLRVLRSQLGRADPALAGRAAGLVGVTPAQFWAGPESAPVPPEDTPHSGDACLRQRATRDSVISLVLSVHAAADRSLGFDQVVELSGNRVTRAQVSTASAALCRDGSSTGSRTLSRWRQERMASVNLSWGTCPVRSMAATTTAP